MKLNEQQKRTFKKMLLKPYIYIFIVQILQHLRSLQTMDYAAEGTCIVDVPTTLRDTDIKTFFIFPGAGGTKYM